MSVGARDKTPEKERFLCGLFAFNSGVKGLGNWAYLSKKLEKGKDGTYVTPTDWDGNYWYIAVTDDGPFATVGWENRREGVKDYRYLVTLKRLLVGASGPAAQEGQNLLTKARRMTPVNRFAKVPRDYRYTWEFDPAPEVTPEAMTVLRKQIAEVIMKVIERAAQTGQKEFPMISQNWFGVFGSRGSQQHSASTTKRRRGANGCQGALHFARAKRLLLEPPEDRTLLSAGGRPTPPGLAGDNIAHGCSYTLSWAPNATTGYPPPALRRRTPTPLFLPLEDTVKCNSC